MNFDNQASSLLNFRDRGGGFDIGTTGRRNIDILSTANWPKVTNISLSLSLPRSYDTQQDRVPFDFH